MKKKLLLISFIFFFSKQSFCIAPLWAWALQAGLDVNHERANAVTIDHSGAIVFTGFYEGSYITFGSTTLNQTLGCTGVFLVKYNSAGSVTWAKRGGGTSNSQYANAHAVVTDASNNIIIAGEFRGANTSFGSTTLVNYSSNYTDIFVAKYDASGNVLWAKRAGKNGNDLATSVATDVSGNIFVAGTFASDSIFFGPDTLIGGGVFLAKYNSSGTALWAKRFNASSISISADNNGNILLTGNHFGTINFTNDSITVTGMYTAKYNTNGTEVWAQGVTGSSNSSNSIATDASGNVLITGTYTGGPVTFGSIVLTNVGNNDLFVTKYNALGNVMWATSVASYYDEFSVSIAVDASGSSYITGSFSNSTLIVASDTLRYGGILVVKFSSSGNALWGKNAYGGSLNSYSIAVDASNNSYIGGELNGTGNFNAINLNNSYDGPDALFAKINAFYLSISSTNELCNGGNSGSATAAPTGGTPPYTYSWSNGGTTATINNLTAGTYSVTVTDSMGSASTQTVVITQPPGFSTSSQTLNNVSCFNGNNGMARAVATYGGTPPYSYLWSPAGGSGQTASGLAAGVYTVTITDAHGCTITSSVVITQPTALTSIISSSNVTCGACNDGLAFVIPGGGTPSYTYSWSPISATIATISNLISGNYTCCVTDAHGCSICSNTTVSFCAVPTTQASNITFTSVNSNSVTVHWTNGNGSRRIVKIKPTNTFTTPTNGTDYTANSIYSGSGEQIVYNGTGNSVNVTGLASNTFYWFRVYEASCTSSSSLYTTSAANLNPRRVFTLPFYNPNRPEADENIEEEINSIRAYPNPTSSSITLETSSNNLLDRVIVSAIDGRIIKSFAVAHSEKVIVDLKELSAGIYFLDCVWDKSSQKIKVVKY